MSWNEFYSRLYNTRGLKSNRSTHILRIWIEWYGSNARDFEQILAFQNKSDLEEYLNKQFEGWFGTPEAPREALSYDRDTNTYEISFEWTPKDDFFHTVGDRNMRSLYFSISNVPICKY